MSCPPLIEYVLTDHAKFEMAQRHISEADVDFVLASPEQTELVRLGRCVYQSKIVMESESPKLLRVFVDVDRDPPEVVTAYHTSKINKYWR